MITTSGFWPWWLGSLVLAALAVCYLKINGFPLGVSGIWARGIHWRESRGVDKAEALLFQSQAALKAELLEMTRKEFGEEALKTMGEEEGSGSAEASATKPHHLTWGASITFLLSVFLGGLLSGLIKGGGRLRFDLGEEFTNLIGRDWRAWLVLFLGGLLVGFGTRMAGGCTSGHGLNGCSRLQPGSLLATASFFGSAVAISFLLARGM